MLNFRNFWGFRGTGTKTQVVQGDWIRGVLLPILMVPNVDSYHSKCCHTQGKAVKMLAAGAEHTAAVTESGKLYGWGWGQYGNLGLGDRRDQMVPVEVVAVNVSHNPFMFMYASHFSAFCFNIASLLSWSFI